MKKKTKKGRVTIVTSSERKAVWRLYQHGNKWYVRFYGDWSTYPVKSFEKCEVSKRGFFFMPLGCRRVEDKAIINKILQVTLV